ncbi:DUF397 domain-containing protein [Streptomyces angustmyceticus]|uniref:Toxin n=1 Tax=Streptomyces angustmyceticus TaxID=285578 RepID=A0A5J4LD29_9ACTN|nr:DUF397 domain-containing protein [Streptomyces angustmyceticus]UAL66971.1 DUF397 domain-containing protein [Streptomyces angustmyceticus]GES32103.1 toxin [Streptomyces angustmyceticus]
MTSNAAQSRLHCLHWIKSSYSGSAGGNCLEIAYDWSKSTYSGSAGGDCLEVATCPHAIHVRDSKNPGGPMLTLSATAWASFLADVAR